jgi:TonB family protein
LAHIKRFDWPVQMLSEIARGVYWFNPLFWLACRWLRCESEHACDDVVLNAGFDAKDYAAHLLELARAFNQSNRAWAPVLAMAQPPNLERRFVAMLNPSLNRRSLTRASLLGICAIAICVCVPLAAMRAPQQPSTAGPAPTPVRVEAPVANTISVQNNDVAKLITVGPPAAKPSPVKPAPVELKPAAPLPVQGLADGTLVGTVSDGSGAVVPGVKLTVTRIDQGAVGQGVRLVVGGGQVVSETTTTGEAGQYRFALPEGLYLLTAELPGFTNAARRVEIKTSQNSRLDIGLSVGTIAQRVQVSAVGQPRPKPVPTGPQRIRVGGNIQAASLIGQVKPIYPQSARDAGIEGTVRLQGIIGVDGRLIGLRVLSSNDPDLATAAMEAVRQWVYRATLLNGSPIEVVTDISVEFALAQ